ncbi:hypothetical protein [Planktothricoides raciborskii]|nr:hypothetical protein [Planktothricoides raciborskii]
MGLRRILIPINIIVGAKHDRRYFIACKQQFITVMLRPYNKMTFEDEFMAFYVMLIKVNEDEHGVTYNFGIDSEHLGKIHLDKHQGIFQEIEAIGSDNYQDILLRAEVKLRQHWKAGNLPDRTCWAS